MPRTWYFKFLLDLVSVICLAAYKQNPNILWTFQGEQDCLHIPEIEEKAGCQ